MTTRRQVLQAGGALVLSSITDVAAFAEESYPAREVHVIAAFPPGSGADIFTRYFAENMRPFLGGTIVVENKVGASGNLALIYVSKAKPDGYTVLIHAPSAIAANLSLFKNPGL
jgi:tripartite-type tricarboxylate transporter receptor subunit TctC